MPSITDTLGSTYTIGWIGSAYFLALGATFPLFHKLYPAISGLSHKWGSLCTLLLVSLLFEGGSLCCYFASSITLLLCGRILCGISAAGVLSGAAFTVEELSPREGETRRIKQGCFLAIYALSRFVGLL
jgi:MFS family permease